MKIPVIDIYHDSIVDGDGLRSVLFVAGCPYRCKGCHNPESWDACNGTPTDIEDIYNELISNELSDGITLSGGEPLLYAKQLLPIVKKIKEETNLNIWCWSGGTYEELIKDEHKRAVLEYVDVLVDGRFILELRDITDNNKYRGSLNQRVLKLDKGVVVKELYPNGWKGEAYGELH